MLNQATVLASEKNLIDLQGLRLRATVQLIQALGAVEMRHNYLRPIKLAAKLSGGSFCRSR